MPPLCLLIGGLHLYGYVRADELICEQVLVHPRPPTAEQIPIIDEANQAARIMFEKRGQNVSSITRQQDATFIYSYKGIPQTVELMDLTGKTFKHLSLASNIPRIKKSSQLIAGETPYIDPVAMYKTYNEWPDVTGIFFTKTKVGPSVIYRMTGLTHPGWVMFRFLPGTLGIYLQDGYYLIPSKPGFKMPIEIVDAFDPTDPTDQKRFPQREFFFLDEKR